MGCPEGGSPSVGSLKASREPVEGVSLGYDFFPLPGQEGGQGDGRRPEADQHPC